MNNKKYRWILYTIVSVIAATIVIQIYWNYKNYQTNKQQLINDVQASLDKAVDDYYAALAENTTVALFLEGDSQKNAFAEGGKLENFFKKSIDTVNNKFTNLDALDINKIDGITMVKGIQLDSMTAEHKKKYPSISKDSFKNTVKQLKRLKGNSALSNIEMLTSKIVVSIKNDTLNLKEVDSFLSTEFERKNIKIKSKLNYYKSEDQKNFSKEADSKFLDKVGSFEKHSLKTISKSTFLPKQSILELHFTNETQTILKRSLTGILISTLLVFGVISCLFYLLKIINHQKQLAEVKNDLISNITHEFKTPIATISAALESISNFNAIDDKAKTKKYLNMSSEQLGKLTIMVEKLLETATLDSDNLELNKEPFDIIILLQDLITKYQMQFPNNTFQHELPTDNLVVHADRFHIENAVNNILDNAVKYGGTDISIDLIQRKGNFSISISDTGTNLTKVHKDQIFEKFYRVQKGNTHDVKGFGIGLYYSKSIIEKHNGLLALELHKNKTTFKITLPHV
ncbi:MAG: sensor histidine kinase [Winogradskyella sp.]|uniref:sensor histidine kinase n=1 Tax=Winogradskyella sp. TaxID=1883156 RepID=UPI00385DB58F